MIQNKTILIALDGADPNLIEKWMEDGHLPHLKDLKERGAYGRVNNPDEKLLELPWLSFYNGVDQGGHGAYHHIQWISEKMKYEGINPKFIKMEPFWYDFKDPEIKILTVDIPFTPKYKTFNGIEINGFASYDTLDGISYYPKNIKKKCEKVAGKAIIFHEKYTVLSKNELSNIKKMILEQTRSLSKLCTTLAENEDWDLFMVAVSCTHRGGHRMWPNTSHYLDEYKGEKEDPVKDLLEIYQAADKLVGEVLSKIPENSNIILCSLHGMGNNQSRSVLLSRMLDRILFPIAKDNHEEKNSALIINYIRKIFPLEIRNKIKNRLPLILQRWITSYLWVKGKDWSKIPAFELIGDYFGAIQINLIGREKYGIVAPGEEYSYWINKIKVGLSTFKNGETGEIVVDKIYERDELGLNGEFENRLPDLIIKWIDSPASQQKNIVSDEYGEIDWPTPGQNPDGRSGNHRNQGFFIGIGNRFIPNSKINQVQIIDFAPTIIDLLGQPIPKYMKGKVLSND